jgi:hypothetical protein
MMEAARTSETLRNFYQGIALMMEAARTSETLINFYRKTRHYNREDGQKHSTLVIPYRFLQISGFHWRISTDFIMISAI